MRVWFLTMIRLHRRAVAATIALLTCVFTTAGCVTNTEGGNPEGWTDIKPAAVPEIAALVPANIKAKGTLTSGTNPPFAPMEFKDSNGNLIGFEMDLVGALASVMGLKFEPVQQDFSRILPSVQAGSLDMGSSGFTDNEERRKSFDFVDYMYAGVQWVQHTGKPIDPNEPCGLTIAVQRTTVSETDDVRPKAEQCLKDGKKPIEVLSYDTSDNAALALVNKRADVFSADSPVSAWAVHKSKGKLELVGDMQDASPYGLAVPKGSQLGVALAKALQYLIDHGDYQRLLDQWSIQNGKLDKALINEKTIQEVKH